MIGLAIQTLRLSAGIVNLTIRLLFVMVRWGMTAVRRRPPATHRVAGGEPAARRDPGMPSRRRAFTAPRRARRTIS